MSILVEDTYAGDVRCEQTWNGYEMYNNYTDEYYGIINADLEDMDEEEREQVVSEAIRENEDYQNIRHFMD